MQEFSIETHRLNYQFGKQSVVEQLSLQVPRGSIYGFLGPNGAGKTTTIKLLLNLLHSSEKDIFLFGEELTVHRSAILSRVGSLIEQPAIYGHLSGRENLYNRALLLGVPKSKVEEVLSVVDLTTQASKKARNYSLGMKQRLGIALALLPDPELLILDEPTNGLDPNGIIEVRKLLMELTQSHQKTVFVSSHLLAEIEKMASHVGIINKGKLVFQGSIAELREINAGSIFLQIDKPEEGMRWLEEQGYSVTLSSERLTLPFTDQQEMGQINTALVQAGFTVYALWRQKKDLEDLFLDMTQN